VSYVEDSDVREATGNQDTLKESKVSLGVMKDIIERASRIFDLVCGVAPEYFEPVASGAVATSRTFYGNAGNYLKLPPYVPGSITTVSFPTGYTALTYIERDGYLIRATDGLLASQYVTPIGWYEGVPIIVTAIWGHEETPADVKHAVIELAINLIRETDPAEVKLVGVEGQPLREKLPPRVYEIARQYRARTGVFI
jgi:hypothetical protein